MKRGTIIIIAVCAVAALIFMRVTQHFMKNTQKETYLTPVKTVNPSLRDMEDVISIIGDVRGQSEVKVSAKVTGKLYEKRKDVGDIVSAEEVVALVDRDDPVLEFKRSEVKSPIDGVVTRYFLDIGESISPQIPIFEVASIDKVKLVVDITEKDIPRIKKGMSARFTVDAYPGKVFYGNVSKIAQSIDMQSRTAKVEIAVENREGDLKPGMFAKAEILVAVRSGAIAVPYDAIGEYGMDKYVFVINGSVASKKPVKTGIVQNGWVEVLSGISRSDNVVSVGWQNLTDGTTVEIVKE